MKWYQIDFTVADEEMVAGETPWNTISYDWGEIFEAEDETDAIREALEYLAREIAIEAPYPFNPYTDIDTENLELNIYDDAPENGGKIVEQYWRFTAREVDENGRRIEVSCLC